MKGVNPPATSDHHNGETNEGAAFVYLGAIGPDTDPLNDGLDTDGDGLADMGVQEDDNDGWSDEEELEAGTDPLDPDSRPRRRGLPAGVLNLLLED